MADPFPGYDPAEWLPPGEPTPARPGTPEKVAVLAERVRRGLSLWHPHDGIANGDEPAPGPYREPRIHVSDGPTRVVAAEALRLGVTAAVLGRRLGCSRFAAHRLLSRLRAEQPRPGVGP